MKTTLFFKRLDLLLQIAAFLIPIYNAVIDSGNNSILVLYPAVGLVQVVSCTLHSIFLNKFLRSKWRGYYEAALLVFIAMAGIGAIAEIGIPGFVSIITMLFSALMAIWYGYFSYTETQYIRRVVGRKEFT
jgi:hypothetical protein